MKKQIYFLVILIFSLLSCSKESSDNTSNSQNGTSGSTARFVLVNNFLYVIDNSNLSTYNVSIAEDPVHINTQEIGFGIETLFPFEDYLLIGSNTGMHIYEIGPSGEPIYISDYEHVETCDPVVAEGDYAYVTLRSTRLCGGNVVANNRLEIYDIQDVKNPFIITQMQLNEPKGLAIDGSYLFVCTADEGIVIIDVSDPVLPNIINTIEGFTANDVIAKNRHLLAVCPDGLRQFDYTDIQNITEVSYLEVSF